ncbi:MAG: bifunctional 4-hydroxy-2-oxoglutarate aldolase/2-dehydro-3-deoxy-phosphogluconate aldolase [Clostridia bacterium]|nr:bifunctional 4-hydroxy-2-oxoglutarate aldolase/2-dehydro-3-deoxy-phosphogluconate aldolase [Clostridia bacterium]MBQ3495135.1 bifunctional 4-hydroxy-2-oxoglutarate aldolase/2-dehydro-3-deoxy-phosphogluconate aldolase [Clostridia bacterium]MBQ4587512.1 bifunctional 4-hydroxy-2-oxoglutarate aldolase/2-dehydro-3-deoxy-phosphogluconate aldolase [Clostridia bacterium]MBQ6882756.1 bifunctional 4-hydroxy-2-oxoglutarate aldolase/2-dehydro-3-deoxy-phosphogluconate aldolase [Clostridia bacterium]MBR29
MNIAEQLKKSGIVPVIVLENVDNSENLAKALLDGGVNVAEVTFRAEGADKVISRMVKAYPDMLVGAGTVLTIEQLDRAKEAGAKFCVAPGLNPAIVKHAQEIGMPFIPGVATATEIEAALSLGITTVKFFPAEQAGGLSYIKAVSAPYPMMRFMPTGGINAENISNYLSFPKVIACGGSWIVAAKLLKEENWAEVTRLCLEVTNKIN